MSYTNDDIRKIILMEGIDYTVTGYLTVDEIEDNRVKELVEEIRRLFVELEEHLEID